MKIRYIFFLVTCSTMFIKSLNNQMNEVKKIILHIDVNKTIICMDLVQNLDTQETINMIIAKHTFNQWDGITEESYFDYLSNTIAKENTQVSRSSEEFKAIRTKNLRYFPIYLEKHYKNLFDNYKREWSDIAKILGIDKQCKFFVYREKAVVHSKDIVIFPSFFQLIDWLENNYKNKYSIVLRTFGSDLPMVVPLIEKNSSIRFKYIGKITQRNLLINEKTENLMTFFNTLDNDHCAIRDDYAYWKSKNFQSIGGKVFPINLTDSNTITMFFDDNADDIYQPIIYPIDNNGNSLTIKKLIDLGVIVPVNSKKAILNKNYFVDEVKKRLKL